METWTQTCGPLRSPGGFILTHTQMGGATGHPQLYAENCRDSTREAIWHHRPSACRRWRSRLGANDHGIHGLATHKAWGLQSHKFKRPEERHERHTLLSASFKQKYPSILQDGPCVLPMTPCQLQAFGCPFSSIVRLNSTVVPGPGT